MVWGICFYCDAHFLPHFKVAIKSLRIVEPTAPVTLISLGEGDFEKITDKYNVTLVRTKRDVLIGGLINSVKSLLFDLTSYDRIIHYDCDFYFRKSVTGLLNCSEDKIGMALGNSRWPQREHNVYWHNYQELAEVHGIKYPHPQTESLVYNAGCFVASRQQESIFKQWQKLLDIPTGVHKRHPYSVDQYIINYLVQTLSVIQEVDMSYNWHITMPDRDVIAVHFANAHKQHLHYKSKIFL